MDEIGDLKSTNPIQTELISTNGNDIPKENLTKTEQIAVKSENKVPENNISTVNCYW